MIEQGYNYLDRSIPEMSGFFETRVENLETPALSPAVRFLTRKKKQKNSKIRKALSFEDSKEVPQTTKFCQCHGKCSHTMDECTTLKALMKKGKSNKSKGYRKGDEKLYTKLEVNVLLQKKLKKAFKGRE